LERPWVMGPERPLLFSRRLPLPPQNRHTLEIGFFLPLPGSDFLDRSRFPYLGGPTDTTRDNPPAVWRKGGKSPVGTLPLESEQLLAPGRIPQLGRPVDTAGQNARAVERIGHRPDRATVAFEAEQFFAAGRVPHFGRPIKIAGHNPPAIRRKGHDLALPREGEQFLAPGGL